MKYLLDTDICIYMLNQTDPALAERVETAKLRRMSVATLTEAELYYGALHSSRPAQNRDRIREFLAPLRVLPFDSAAAQVFADVKESLVSRGKPSGAIDMLIAAVAVAHSLILVTNNVKHYRTIPGLRVENWTTRKSAE